MGYSMHDRVKDRIGRNREVVMGRMSNTLYWHIWDAMDTDHSHDLRFAVAMWMRRELYYGR